MADILVIDDQDRTVDLCRRAMPNHRYRGPARDWRSAKDALARGRGRIDLVMLDVHFDIATELLLGVGPNDPEAQIETAKRTQGLRILKEIRKLYPNLPIVVMTARDDLVVDAQLADEDVTYFVDDEAMDVQGLRILVSRAVDATKLKEFDGPVYWGRSLVMGRIRQKLAIMSQGRLPVMMLGPTGTGKSLIVRHFVHPRSGRSGPLVTVDLSTVPQDLMAAHLFGSVRGAYTGAVSDRIGAFEQANGGTLFLDEIGNLSMDAQKMLLSVLQEGVVTRVGDAKERRIDVKLVTATNEDLRKRSQAGTFRMDLYMRLNPAAAVTLPALKERRWDWERLLEFVTAQALAREGIRELVRSVSESVGCSREVTVRIGSGGSEAASSGLVLAFPERAFRMLRSHSWPGNLREFSMVIENAVLFALAEAAGLESHTRSQTIVVRPKVLRDMLVPLAEAGEEVLEGGRLSFALSPAETLNKVAQSCERQYFEQLWRRYDGDFGRMATALLGDESHRRKVQLRFNQLGLKVRDLRGTSS